MGGEEANGHPNLDVPMNGQLQYGLIAPTIV